MGQEILKHAIKWFSFFYGQLVNAIQRVNEKEVGQPKHAYTHWTESDINWFNQVWHMAGKNEKHQGKTVCVYVCVCSAALIPCQAGGLQQSFPTTMVNHIFIILSNRLLCWLPWTTNRQVGPDRQESLPSIKSGSVPMLLLIQIWPHWRSQQSDLSDITCGPPGGDLYVCVCLCVCTEERPFSFEGLG